MNSKLCSVSQYLVSQRIPAHLVFHIGPFLATKSCALLHISMMTCMFMSLVCLECHSSCNDAMNCVCLLRCLNFQMVSSKQALSPHQTSCIQNSKVNPDINVKSIQEQQGVILELFYSSFMYEGKRPMELVVYGNRSHINPLTSMCKIIIIIQMRTVP